MATGRRSSPHAGGTTDGLSRREFLQRSAGLIGAAGLVGPALFHPAPARAFPPDEFFQGVARMVFHENPWGPHPAAMEAIGDVLRKGLAGGGVNRYPDEAQYELKRAILRYNGLDGVLTVDNVILGVGSAEVLFMAADAFTSPESPFLSEWITYRIILQRAEQNGAEVMRVSLLPNWTPDLDRMHAEAAGAQAGGRPFGLIHFNVINNPAGTYLEQETFDAFARRIYRDAPETVLLCDDSDWEFMDETEMPRRFRAARHVVEGRNMLHVQTFSHAFGLTGLRVGYGIAPERIIRRLEAHRIFAGTNVVGQAAALASLENAEEQTRRCNRFCGESRRQVYEILDALGLEYLPSQGHYILLNLGDLDGTMAVLQMYLLQKVFVRWGSEWELDTWIRVNPGTEWENGRFSQALTWLLSQRRLRGLAARDYLATAEGARVAREAVRRGVPAHVLRVREPA